MAFDETAGVIKHYRVDKMLDVSLMEEVRSGKEVFEAIDMAAYSKKTFGMFAGEEKTVRLLCDNSMIGVIVDEFGTEVAIRKEDEEHIMARMDVAVSPQFFGWLAGLGNRVEIIAPAEVREEYTTYLTNVLNRYNA